MSPRGEVLEVVEALGEGGFAATYRARVLDPRLVREWGTDMVAVKVPHSKAHEKALIQELILSSHVTETLRALSGAANVVRYLGFEQLRQRDRYVMVMEYVSGGSLRDRIGYGGSRQALPLEPALHIADGILTGLAAIHAAGVFHRDIKPENILMDGETPKIADLGISKVLHTQERASTRIGTLAYVSPETLDGRGATFASDVWAVGATVYEMLTGSSHLGDDDIPEKEMMDRIFKVPAPAPSDRRPEVPPWLDAIVLRALRKEPAQRYASAEQMKAAFAARDGLDDRITTIRQLLLGDDLRQAERAVRALIAEFPRSSRAREYLGEVHNRQLRHADAIRAFQDAIELDPGNALLHWSLALAYQRVGNARYASQSLRQAIELGLEPRIRRHATSLLRSLGESVG